MDSDIPLLTDDQVSHLARISWRQQMMAEAKLLRFLDAARLAGAVVSKPSEVQSDLFQFVDVGQNGS